MTPRHAVQPNMRRRRSAFRSQVQLPGCELAHEQYDLGDSELKQEIPVSLLGKVLGVSENGIESWG